MTLPAPRPAGGLVRSAGRVVRSLVELSAPGLVVGGAVLALVPGQYVALKTALAAWGIAPMTAALLAPLAAAATVWGVRWALRSTGVVEALREVRLRDREPGA